MRNLKKLVALIVTLALMATFAIPAFAAPADVVGTEYEGAVSRLVALTVLTGDPDGNFRPNDSITRAEVAAVVVRALGYEDVAESAKGVTKFSDVPATYWASGYINLAVSLGIINGYGNGKFGPADKVLYEQAVAMLVRALGQGALAETKGGYPSGYLVQAKTIGFTTDVKGVSGVGASRGVVAQLVDNAKAKPIYYQDTIGSSQSYKPSVDANGNTTDSFVIRLGINKRAAGVIITETPATAGLDANKFVAGGTTYTAIAGAVDIESLLGKKADLWGKDKDHIVLAENVVGTAVAVKTVDSVTDAVYKVTLADGTKKDYKVAAGAGALENLEVTTAATAVGNLVAKAADKVQASFVVDGDGNIQYVNSVIFNKDVVATVAVENKVAKTIKLGAYTLKSGDDSVKKIVVAKDGETIDYTAIVKGDILFVAENLNDTGIKDDYLYIKATDKTVEGTLEAIKGTLAEPTSLKVEGTWYDISSFKTAANFGSVASIVGGEVTVKLDPAGKAYSVSGATVASTTKYGVILGNESAYKLGDYVYTARILTADNTKVDYTVKNTIAAVSTNNDPAIKNKLVSYTVNADGIIDSLTIAQDSTATALLDTSRSEYGAVGTLASDVVFFTTSAAVKTEEIKDDENATSAAVFKDGNKILAVLLTTYVKATSAANYAYIVDYVTTGSGKYTVDFITKDGADSIAYENATPPTRGSFVTYQIQGGKMVNVTIETAPVVTVGSEKLDAADASKINVDGTNYWYTDKAFVVYDVDADGAGASILTKDDVAVDMEAKLYLVGGAGSDRNDVRLVVITKM